MSDDDLADRLRRLGLRVGRDALAAFLAHVHKSRLGPTETLEQLAELEERARVAVKLYPLHEPRPSGLTPAVAA